MGSGAGVFWGALSGLPMLWVLVFGVVVGFRGLWLPLVWGVSVGLI